MPSCADCGFLALRQYSNRELVETERGMRESWKQPVPPGSKSNIYEDWPVCFARELDFQHAAEHDTSKLLRVIQADRQCSKYVLWKQGFTPKEHQEMIDHIALQKFQAEQREREQRFQDERRERDRRLEDERREKDQRREDDLRKEDRAYQDSRKKEDRAYQESRDRKSRQWNLWQAVGMLILSTIISLLVSWLVSRPGK